METDSTAVHGIRNALALGPFFTIQNFTLGFQVFDLEHWLKVGSSRKARGNLSKSLDPKENDKKLGRLGSKLIKSFLLDPSFQSCSRLKTWIQA